MAWIKQYGGEDGTTAYWVDDQTGASSMTEPTSAAPNYQTRATSSGGLETLNPQTGQWEPSYRLGGNNAGVSFVPKSLAGQYPGSFLVERNAPAQNSGGFFEDYALPAVIGGIATAGLGSMFSGGMGSLFGGPTPNLTGGLQDFMSMDAASSAGLSSGGSMDFGQLFDEMFGPSTDTSAITNTGGGNSGLSFQDTIDQMFPSQASGGGTGGYTLDMSGHAIDAAGNVVNGTDGSLMDFMKGAIQSGNIDQLMKVLPSIPGGSTALKTIFGGGSGSAGLSSLFGGGAGGGKYSADIGGILNSILGYTTNKDYQKSLIDVMNRSIDAADPFKSQRPFYQQQLQSMFTDPNYFNNNALLKGANDMAVNDTTRKLASQGYNMSGNVPMEVGQRLQQNNMGYAQKLMDFTGQAAGASINPSSSGQVAATTGAAVANAGNAGNASLGNLFNTVWNGQQPSLADQYLGGAQKNPNLGSVLFS